MTEELLGRAVEGAQNLPSGAWGYHRAGKQGDLMVSQLHGAFFEPARRGDLWMYTGGGAGVTVLKYDNVNPALVLWNKSVAYQLELVELSLAWAGTPAVAGNIGLGVIPGAGTTLGTPITAFTELATVFQMSALRQGNPSNGKLATSSTIVGLAAGVYFPFISLPDAMAAASTTAPPYITTQQFRGDFLVPPGCAIVLCGSVAQTQPMGVRLSWVDNVPV